MRRPKHDPIAAIEGLQDLRLKVLLHGGNPKYAPRLADGLTKREQVRLALEASPFVERVIFAEEVAQDASVGPDEQMLFAATDATVILIELSPEHRGSRSEATLHSAQPGAFDKVQVLIPPDLHAPWSLRRGFEAINAATSFSLYHVFRYTQDDYEQCRLVDRVLEFVGNRWTQIYNQRKDQLIRELTS